jgi:hypothetical protein
MAGTLTISTLSDGTNSTSTTNCISGSAKAWVNFNGTTAGIRASYNVSSITRNATGDYTINYTNAFADTNYATVASSSAWYATQWNYGVSLNTTTSSATQSAPTTTSTRIFQYTVSGAYDPIYVSFAAYR